MYKLLNNKVLKVNFASLHMVKNVNEFQAKVDINYLLSGYYVVFKG